MTEKNYQKLIILLYVLNKLLEHLQENAYDLTLNIIEIVKEKLRREKFSISDFDVSSLDKGKIIRNASSSLKTIQKEYPNLEEDIEWLLFVLKTKMIYKVLKNESEGEMKR